MNYLQYKSDEMYSSTQLIRQSKMIFDKLNKNEIEKAIILRDGRPSFMLLDFKTYERIMTEYMKLKEPDNAPIAHKKSSIQPESETTYKESLDEKEQAELEKALEEIENLDMSSNELSKEELKEFWD